eukprot:9934899-Heterocapsa_arctica.AAC.1
MELIRVSLGFEGGAVRIASLFRISILKTARARSTCSSIMASVARQPFAWRRRPRAQLEAA